MSLPRRLMFSSLWAFVIGMYRRFELDIVSPAIERVREFLIDLSSAEKGQSALVDLALFLFAFAVFVWMCCALRKNWVFQQLYYVVYQVVAFVFFGYGALFSWQTMVFIALVYPDYIESVRQFLFEPYA